MKLKPAGPLLQMTLALVALCSMLILLADLLFGVFPDTTQRELRLRKQVGEALAVQMATLMRSGDARALQQTMDEVARRTPAMRSIGLRRADGTLSLQTGPHQATWTPLAAGASTAHQIDVPLHADGKRWGGVEIAFQPDDRPAWRRWLAEPLVATMLFMGSAGLVVFSLYMRRALQHLDPASVIPDRVQGAFDAMGEGVVVLDIRGRLLLSNMAFRALNSRSAELRTGQSLSTQPWIQASLGHDAIQHPWMRAINTRQAVTGQTVEAVDATGQVQQLVINSVPITDAGQRVRGCLASFSDVSQLHRANAELRRAMDELSASQAQVQRQNEELTRLATRDPLTGCLNRRAFTEGHAQLFAQALAQATPLSCIVLDIDFFKKVNDNHGHSVGDRVIQEVAHKLSDLARPCDLVCRYGGEEFCVALPGLETAEAAAFAERVRTCIEQTCGPAVEEVPGMVVTVSIGVASLGAGVAGTGALIDLADQALYRAKREGRNRVVAQTAALAQPVAAEHTA